MARPLTIGLAAALALTACGDDETAPSTASDDPGTTAGGTSGSDGVEPDGSVLDGDWVLTSGRLDGTDIPLVDGWDVTMSIDGADVGGTAACNSYGGRLTGDASGVSGDFGVTEVFQTEMACEPDVMDVESQFLRALTAITAYELDGGLTLTADDPATNLVFERAEPVPTVDVVGTTWVLDTVIEGDAASNSPGMEFATLTLNADGTLNGSTGCRQLAGEWVEDGASIRFTQFEAIDDPAAGVCAPESEQLDATVVEALGAGFTVEIDGQRLTVMSRGGVGLSYTATDG